jgi:hypothetical protein
MQFPLASPSLTQEDDEPPAGISQSLGGTKREILDDRVATRH